MKENGRRQVNEIEYTIGDMTSMESRTMSNINPEAPRLIDEYIMNAPEFAQPICRRLRELIHAADPEIEEDWKWGPNFNKKGMICGIWAFKNHVTFTFFEGALLGDKKNILQYGTSNRHNRAVKFTRVDEIDERTLIAYIKEAVIINEYVLSSEKQAVDIPIPPDLKKVMVSNKQAKKFFEGLAYTYRKEFVNWITSARQLKTRERRLAKAIEMLEQGKRMGEK